jgi:hypothetical protein
MTIDRINVILSMNLAKGILYSKLILKRVEVSRQLLIVTIDSDQYAFLDKDLSQNKYP